MNKVKAIWALLRARNYAFTTDNVSVLSLDKLSTGDNDVIQLALMLASLQMFEDKLSELVKEFEEKVGGHEEK